MKHMDQVMGVEGGGGDDQRKQGPDSQRPDMEEGDEYDDEQIKGSIAQDDDPNVADDGEVR